VGLQGGYTGEGVKTIVPAWAEAKISFRLVADQHPDAISELFEAWVRRNVPQGIRVDIEPHGGVAPARTPTDHWSFGALTRAIERVWGAPPLLTRVGGSGPEEALGRVLAAPVLFLGVGLPDDRIHAPNERMVMAQFWRGLLAAGELWAEMAAANPRAWPAATPAEP
jgi:acetylornithine deacetylase/succinyl-diaminopimelate desuccinylase-like protein